jgi:hypothetical protein
MTDRKKPGVGFWATVVVITMLVGYPLSFGPACWITSRGILEPALTARAYYPIVWISARGPRAIRDAIRWYGEGVGFLQIELGILSRLD